MKKRAKWSDGLVEWVDGDVANVSIAFSWKAQEAYRRVAWWAQQGYRVRVGGPGLFATRKHFEGIAEIGGEVGEAIVRHNPDATMASRGCPVGCSFCIVPKMEGKEFALLPEFEPRPILCDNNLSALPVEYQEHIIEKYKRSGVSLLDANSGFEPRTFDEGTYRRWKPIMQGPWRFGYDEQGEKEEVCRMTRVLKNERSDSKRVYVLIGNEPFDACYGRIMNVIEWGCEPFVQPMIALNAEKKEPILRFDWKEQWLRDLTRWANKWVWRSVPFSEYDGSFKKSRAS